MWCEYSKSLEKLSSGSLSERWFGDGPPHWREGKKNRLPKCTEGAANERKQIVRLLKKSDDPAAASLRRKLKKCDREQRCSSPACPECRRACQRAFVWVIKSFLKRESETLSTVSLIPARLTHKEGDLAEQRPFDHLRAFLEEALDGASIDRVVGGFDISMNEHAGGKFAPYWQPHCWLIMPKGLIDQKRKYLRPALQSDPERTPRPLKVTQFDGDPRALAYCLKTDFFRRITLAAKTGEERRNVRYRPLKASQRIELALTLDTTKWCDRIYCRKQI